MSFDALQLIPHFLVSGNQLPSLFDRLNPEHKQQATFAYGSFVRFTVLHELGHLAMRHGCLAGSFPTLSTPMLFFKEDYTLFKNQENQADSFAFEALLPEFCDLFLADMFMTLRPFSMLESLSGWVANSHPLVINRIFHIIDKHGFPNDASLINSMNIMFKNDYQLFSDRMSNLLQIENIELLLAEDPARILFDIFFESLPSEQHCTDAAHSLGDIYSSTLK